MTQEFWKKIPGWAEAYEASNLGNIRSVTRKIKGSAPNQKFRIMKGKQIKPLIMKNGYKYVNLSIPDGRPRVVYVHHLILLAFVGPKPETSEEIRHLNGVKTDCRLDNLVYGTCKENAMDRKIHGQMGGRKRVR